MMALSVSLSLFHGCAGVNVVAPRPCLASWGGAGFWPGVETTTANPTAARPTGIMAPDAPMGARWLRLVERRIGKRHRMAGKQRFVESWFRQRQRIPRRLGLVGGGCGSATGWPGGTAS